MLIQIKWKTISEFLYFFLNWYVHW